MGPDARERYLLGWAHSRIAQRRSAFGAFRKLLTFLAYADPGGDPPNPNLRAVGYRPDDPPITRDLSPVRPYALPATGGRDDPMTLDADAVVVGSGAGGGVVAAALAAAGPVGRRARGRPVRDRGVDAAQGGRRLRPALPRSRPGHDLGRLDHDAGRDRGRRRDPRQLDDLHPGARGRSGPSGRPSTAWRA